MKKVLFKGCGTAIVTPFIGEVVNFKVLKQLIEFQIAGGVDALIVCGTTGESCTLSAHEHKEVVEFAVKEVNKRVPVIAGTGTNDTRETIELSQFAASAGVDGIMCITPYCNKPSQKGLIAHYTEIAKAIPIPIILYNVPSRTNVKIEFETYEELSKISNIVATKEASGDLELVGKVFNELRERLRIYSGNDNQNIEITRLGGIGTISVLGNIMPEYTSKMLKLQMKDYKFDEALQMQTDVMELINLLFCESNPVPVKAALNMMGYNVGSPRLPLLELEEEKQLILKKAMDKKGLIIG